MHTKPCTTPGRSCAHDAAAVVDWREELPEAWRGEVVVPRVFSVQREYEIAARRVLGAPGHGEAACYCRYDVVLTALRSDDDEAWFTAATYGERLTAWRLRDDRWLIHRRIQFGEDCDQARSFFSFAEEMPR